MFGEREDYKERERENVANACIAFGAETQENMEQWLLRQALVLVVPQRPACQDMRQVSPYMSR